MIVNLIFAVVVAAVFLKFARDFDAMSGTRACSRGRRRPNAVSNIIAGTILVIGIFVITAYASTAMQGDRFPKGFTFTFWFLVTVFLFQGVRYIPYIDVSGIVSGMENSNEKSGKKKLDDNDDVKIESRGNDVSNNADDGERKRSS